MAIGGGRINDDTGGGFRGSTASFGSSASAPQRGGTGAEQGVTSSAIAGNPHSSSGFRRALMKSQKSQGSLKGQLMNSSSAGKGFGKPNYFAQGGQRHGIHIGSGIPTATPATDTSDDSFGGE